MTSPSLRGATTLGARGTRAVRVAKSFPVLLALCLLAALAVAGCGTAGSGEASAQEIAERKIRVTTTTNWHTDLARQLGGDRVEVTGLMGPGVDPHLYEATAGDVDSLSESDIAIWNALNLEGKMEEVFAEVRESVPVVAVGEAVPVEQRIPVENVPGEEFDPHIWFDASAWRRAAGAVAGAYKALDPRHAAGYDKRLHDFVSVVERTDAAIRERVERIPERSRVLVTSHDAFSYFARSYGFRVAPIQGKSTAAEATTADIERVGRTIAEADLNAVFIETSVPRQTIEAVLAAARERGKPTKVGGELYGDALGRPGTPEGTYAGAVRHNAEAIVAGLEGGRAR